MSDAKFLHEFSAEDLIVELCRRHDTLVLGLIDPLSAKKFKFDIRVHGDIGVASLIAAQIVAFLTATAAQSVSSARLTLSGDDPSD